MHASSAHATTKYECAGPAGNFLLSLRLKPSISSLSPIIRRTLPLPLRSISNWPVARTTAMGFTPPATMWVAPSPKMRMTTCFREMFLSTIPHTPRPIAAWFRSGTTDPSRNANPSTPSPSASGGSNAGLGAGRDAGGTSSRNAAFHATCLSSLLVTPVLPFEASAAFTLAPLIAARSRSARSCAATPAL